MCVSGIGRSKQSGVKVPSQDEYGQTGGASDLGNAKTRTQDVAENVLQRVRVEIVDAQQVVVPLVPLRNRGAAATGRAHRGDEQTILHHTKRVVPRVPPVVVEKLPQQFDRGLRAVGFFLGLEINKKVSVLCIAMYGKTVRVKTSLLVRVYRVYWTMYGQQSP